MGDAAGAPRPRRSERAAFAFDPVHADGAALRFDEPLGQREAEPGAAAPLAIAGDLLELAEQPRDALGRDSDAGVLDLDAHAIVIGRRRAQPDVPTLGREL